MNDVQETEPEETVADLAHLEAVGHLVRVLENLSPTDREEVLGRLPRSVRVLVGSRRFDEIALAIRGG